MSAAPGDPVGAVPAEDQPGDAGEPRPVAALFAEVVGQHAAVSALRAAARNPVHAYLLLGPPGSGRSAAARGFAAALVCPEGGCGDCAHCRRALAGTHPDLVLVERSGASLSVDEARRLVAAAQRRPLESSRQVLVVNDVHLAARSAPALLKTVEEPPPTTVFVLLAEDVPPELVTVASRCVTVVFTPVPTQAVVGWLVGRGVEAERARLIADGAGGDLRRAQVLAEDEGFAARLDLWRSVPERLRAAGASPVGVARALVGAADDGVEPLKAAHAAELARLEEESKALKERALPGRKEITDRHKRAENRWRADEVRAGLAVIAREYRDVISTSLAQDDADSVSRAARAARAVDAISKAAASMEHNPNETLMLEGLLVRLRDLGV